MEYHTLKADLINSYCMFLGTKPLQEWSRSEVSHGLKLLDVPAPLVTMMFDIGVTGDLIVGGLLHGSEKLSPL